MIIIDRSLSNFNPRSREGSDYTVSDMQEIMDISIHAPVKGATRPPERHDW